MWVRPPEVGCLLLAQHGPDLLVCKFSLVLSYRNYVPVPSVHDLLRFDLRDSLGPMDGSEPLCGGSLVLVKVLGVDSLLEEIILTLVLLCSPS